VDLNTRFRDERCHLRRVKKNLLYGIAIDSTLLEGGLYTPDMVIFSGTNSEGLALIRFFQWIHVKLKGKQ
jgi:hypothetical protein